MSYFDNKSQDGLAAYKTGKSLDDNPYPEGSARYWQWFSGFRAGEAFHERGNFGEAISKLVRYRPYRWNKNMTLEDKVGEYVRFNDVVDLLGALKGQQHDK